MDEEIDFVQVLQMPGTMKDKKVGEMSQVTELSTKHDLFGDPPFISGQITSWKF